MMHAPSQIRGMPLRILAGLLVFCLLVLTVVRCGRGGRPSVLLITVDTLRADRLGCYGYPDAQTPTMDRLAAEGLLFEQVACHVPVTLPSHATILTGLSPASHGVHDNSSFRLPETVTSMAEIFADAGSETGAIIGAYVLARQFGLEQGFGDYDDSFEGARGSASEAVSIERPATEVASRGIAWLREHRRTPFFLWLHFFDPHTPYNPPPVPGRQQSADPYDGEIAYVDRELTGVVRVLKELGLERSTLVVLTSDHGEGLGNHEEETHGVFLYESTLRVPLILRWPGRLPAGARVSGLVRTLDIAPTVLRLAGLRVPESMAGMNLVEDGGLGAHDSLTAVGESMLPLYHYGLEPLVSVRTSRWKYIAAPRPELYDLVSDPCELRNLAGTHAEQVAQLSPLAAAYTEELQRGESAAAAVNATDATRLAALGYLSTPASDLKQQPRLQRGDPKDYAWLVALTGRALSLVGSGKADQALSQVRQALRDNPDVPLLRYLEGWALYRTGRYHEAGEALHAALETDSSYTRAWELLAEVQLATGRPTAALESLDRALALTPFQPWALVLKGRALRATGQHVESVAAFRQALRVQPSYHEARFNLAEVFAALGMADSALVHAIAVLPHALKPATMLVLIGRCYEATERWREAADAYSRAVTHDPTQASVHKRMTYCYARAGMDREATVALEEYLSRYGEDSAILSLMAGRRLAHGDTAEAADNWERAVELDSTNVGAWAGLLTVASHRGALAAREVATRALAACPEDSALRTLVARLTETAR